MDKSYLLFQIDECSFAIPSHYVDRVERAVSLSVLPDKEEPVIGAINVAGKVLPVLGLRGRMGREERQPIVSDRLIFIDVEGIEAVLLVDIVGDVVELSDLSNAQDVWPGISSLDSFSGFDDSVLVITDLKKMLTSEKIKSLCEALEELMA